MSLHKVFVLVRAYRSSGPYHMQLLLREDGVILGQWTATSTDEPLQFMTGYHVGYEFIDLRGGGESEHPECVAAAIANRLSSYPSCFL